ncbi:HNH endonuclease signature motif containing protein [Acidipropionibacterium thoenii]|uniref:HNH endonuclease signature motif containing protein n=1 Tax=Acidipropionibacterium thoenii TaxID=1751 RepID=UPI0004167FD3|nr:HNH endonuclease signature motif containing protein [Acidipropionibacterium thoenii]
MEPVSDFWAATRVISQALDGLNHTALTAMPDTEKVQAMTCLRTLARRLEACARVATDAVSTSAACDRATGLMLADFLAREEGRSASEGLGEVHRASAMTADDTVRDAALAGTITPDHAVAIGRQIRRLPLDEMTSDQKKAAAGQFIDAARTSAPGQLSRQTLGILAATAPRLAPDAKDRAARIAAERRQAVAERRFRWGEDGHGSVWLSATLPQAEGRQVIATLQAFTEKGRQAERTVLETLKAQRNQGTITTARYLALRREADQQGARTTAQRMADALVDATHQLAGMDLVPSAGGEPPRIVVTIGYEYLHRALQGLIDAGTLEGQVPVDAGTLRRMCCDAQILPVVLGSDSQTLDVGRSERLVTPALRRALEHRDGGCIYPGCTTPARLCQAHHVRPWWAGGATRLDNLVLVCRHHHAIVEPDRHHDRDQPTIVFDPTTGTAQVVEPTRLKAYRAHHRDLHLDRRTSSPDPRENSARFTDQSRTRPVDPDSREDSARTTDPTGNSITNPHPQENSAHSADPTGTRPADLGPPENSAQPTDPIDTRLADPGPQEPSVQLGHLRDCPDPRDEVDVFDHPESGPDAPTHDRGRLQEVLL